MALCDLCEQRGSGGATRPGVSNFNPTPRRRPRRRSRHDGLCGALDDQRALLVVVRRRFFGGERLLAFQVFVLGPALGEVG